MKPFSEQIRDAIEATGVSRYAIAEQTGISESVLSRFMSGSQSMSLASLDKIADALGLQVVVGVSSVQKPRKPGRPKTVEPNMKNLKSLTKTEYVRMAANAANAAYKENFASRRGVYVVAGAGIIIYYDNNPFRLPREDDPREMLIEEFRSFLKKNKLKEKACAYWPVSGESKDHTFAMVIQAEDFMLESIRSAFHSIITAFMNGMRENGNS